MRSAMLAGLFTGVTLLAGAAPALARTSPPTSAAPALARTSPPTSAAPALAQTSPRARAKPKPKPVHHHKRPFAAVEVGNRLSTTGRRFEDIYRVKKSPFGEGSVIRDATLGTTAFPATGTDIAKTYDRGGRTFAHETFTLAPPNIDGLGTITGNGTCRSGTGTHHGETCTYTIKGTYDLITGITRLALAGTYTLGSHAKPPR